MNRELKRSNINGKKNSKKSKLINRDESNIQQENKNANAENDNDNLVVKPTPSNKKQSKRNKLKKVGLC